MPDIQTPILDQLLTERVIQQTHRDNGYERLKHEAREPYRNAGEALIWLSNHDILSTQEILEIVELSVSQAAFAGNDARVQAVEQMRAALGHHAPMYLGQAAYSSNQEVMNAAFSSRNWIWAGGGLIAAAAAAIWYMLSPAATPMCNDSDVQQTIRSSLFSQSVRILMQPKELAPADFMSAKFSDVEELGYIKDSRSRGCSARLTVKNLSDTIAYTITPIDNGDDMLVQSGDPRVLRARYRQTDEALGQPLGADKLSQAFTEGINKTTANLLTMEQTVFGKHMQRMRQLGGLPAETDTRKVRNIRPLDNCKDLGNGKWSCLLQAEDRDSFMSAFNKGEWKLIEADFDFVQDGDTWRVSDDFAKQFARAMTATRVGTITNR